MSTLNDLYGKVRPGSPVTSEELAATGVSADLAVHYVRAGWLTRLARGGFARPDTLPELHPSLRLLERRLKSLHVGGKSALDWQDVAQQPCTAALRLGIRLTSGFSRGSLPTIM
jgi:hypothetical protein